MVGYGWFKQQALAPRMQALYDQMLVSGVNFLTLVYLGRRLDPEAFGFFTLAFMSIIGLSTLQSALVIQPFNLIGATRPPMMNLGHLHALLRVHAILWLPLNLVLLAVVSWFFFPDPLLFAAAGLYLCVFLLQELLRRHWYTCGEIGQALANDAIGYGLQLPMLLWWATQPQFGPAVALGVMAFGPTLALLHGWHRLRGRPRSFMPLHEVIGAHWNTGAWLLLATVSAYSATQLFPYMLSSIGVGAVAAFAAARNVLNALNVGAQAATNYLPIASRRILERDGVANLATYLKRVAMLLAVVAGVFCAAAALEAQDLLYWIYGKSFDGTQHLVPLLALAAFGTMLFPVTNAGLMVLRKTPVIFVANVAATIFNVSAGWWLIGRYGVNGAAIAASASVMLVLAIQLWCLRAALGKSEGRFSTRAFLKNVPKPCMSS